MSGIFIFVNTAPFIRPGRDEEKIPLSVNIVLLHLQNTVIGQYRPVPFAKYR
jgi:hypothetical protein